MVLVASSIHTKATPPSTDLSPVHRAIVPYDNNVQTTPTKTTLPLIDLPPIDNAVIANNNNVEKKQRKIPKHSKLWSLPDEIFSRKEDKFLVPV